MKGRIHVFEVTWPWGKKEKDTLDALLDEPGNPKQAMRDLIAMATRGNPGPSRKKKPKK